MKPIISVCIPVYNVEHYIEKCINSVLRQSFQDFEIIVINDASPDNSIDIVKSLICNDKRIRVFENAQNMGLMWTRREGYIRAIGDYILFLDSDDTLPPNALYDLYMAISSSDSDVVCGQIAYITSLGLSLDKYPNQLLYGYDSESALKSTLRWEITHNLCGKIYKREILQSYNYDTYKDVINAEDALLFYQVIPNVNKITAIPNVVYNYYMYDNSSTNVVLGERALRGIFLWQKHRYNMIYRNYPFLLEELYTSMAMYLSFLTPSLNNKELINEYLLKYEIPFKLNFLSIVRYIPKKKLLKSFISYFFSDIVKKYRCYRLKQKGVK